MLGELLAALLLGVLILGVLLRAQMPELRARPLRGLVLTLGLALAGSLALQVRKVPTLLQAPQLQLTATTWEMPKAFPNYTPAAAVVEARFTPAHSEPNGD